jgi:predicted ATP-grasp superfamily ATP-dependent carboligase
MTSTTVTTLGYTRAPAPGVCHTAGVEFVEFEAQPALRKPVLVAAFRGWNDAGGAASLAAGYLRTVTDAERVAVIDCDPFVDYQQTRPTVQLVDGDVRRVDWPVTEVHASVPHNLVVVTGAEPNMRWKAFAHAVVGVAQQFDTSIMVSLGALLADTPHTRPVPVSASSNDPDLVTRHGVTRSTYEGPTGIVGVLHDACAQAGMRSASLWAATPHYISAAPNPQAAAALLDRLHVLVDTPEPSREMQTAASEYALRVAAAIADDPDVAGYVEQLEEQADSNEEPPSASGDELAADFERYLRERSEHEDE